MASPRSLAGRVTACGGGGGGGNGVLGSERRIRRMEAWIQTVLQITVFVISLSQGSCNFFSHESSIIRRVCVVLVDEVVEVIHSRFGYPFCREYFHL